MTIEVRLYSILRERDGRIVDRLEIELPEGSQAGDVLNLLDVPDNLEVVLAVNDQVISESDVLKDNDRLAIIPAIAGGAVTVGLSARDDDK